MTTTECQGLTDRAISLLLDQVNSNQFGEMNEATLQHHLAVIIHLESLKDEWPDVTMTLEKKVRRAAGLFPKKQRATANIDIFFQQRDDGTRYALELKCFHKQNHREPNNRYDAYADLANLEVYLDEHADAGTFFLLTDHRHYFDNAYFAHSVKTSDFSLRDNHEYISGKVLSYRTEKPYGPDLALQKNYRFVWANPNQNWRALVVKIER